MIGRSAKRGERERERERAGFHNHISMEVFSKPIASTLSRGPARPANAGAALAPWANRAPRRAPSECRPLAKARETRLVLPSPRGWDRRAGGREEGSERLFPLRFFRALYSNIVVTTRRENIYRRGGDRRPATARPRLPPPSPASLERISRPAKETESAIESSERAKRAGSEP